MNIGTRKEGKSTSPWDKQHKADEPDNLGNGCGMCRIENHSKPVNIGCEFHDRRDNRNICLIHMDMDFCSKDCAFATTAPGSTAPYGSRYMRGRS